MVGTLDKLTAHGCSTDDKHKVCRSRGGESCAFDGAMIVLQPIADTAHLVHGPIACCGNSWEGRGTLSAKGDLHTRGFTTDMGEMDIVYGSEDKLLAAIEQTAERTGPKAIFVYSTCVSGLIGEDIEAVCKKAETKLGIRVIPVSAPGFVGPKNLGNRIAGDVLLEHVIGTGETPVMTHTDINLIGEYNIAGDLWLVEPLLAKAGIRVLSRITGDSTFEEITWAHQAKLNVVVCGRALINVAREMERRYGVPYVEVSFFGATETAKALRTIAYLLQSKVGRDEPALTSIVEELIKSEDRMLKQQLMPHQNLRGKKAVLYTGGVKSWSFISALRDLGIDVVAVGTKKSTYEDEEKMKALLGPDAPLVENVTPANLLKLLREKNADILVAGGRNLYLAAKEGYPFVDVNQERHVPYAGYQGLVNLAEQISNSVCFYERSRGIVECETRNAEPKDIESQTDASCSASRTQHSALRIDPLKHSPAIGAAMALQGIDKALPVIHGAQGCTFLGKVLLTRHFREPIALASSKLFVEDVVMGSEEKLETTLKSFMEKNAPDLLAVLTTGLAEVKGDDVAAAVRRQESEARRTTPHTRIIHIATPDYDGGLEKGYARAVEAVIESEARKQESGVRSQEPGDKKDAKKSINVLIGSHLTPADFCELREIIEAFDLKPVLLPDLSSLDGSRKGVSALALDGTTMQDLRSLGDAALTIGIGISLEPAAKLLEQRFNIKYRMFEGLAGLADSDRLMQSLSKVSGKAIPTKFSRQRAVLIDTMRDAHFSFGNKKVCIGLEPDHAVQTSKWLGEMGASVELAVIPTLSDAADRIRARSVQLGDLASMRGPFDLLIANSHAAGTAARIGAPLYEAGFPVFKSIGYTSKVTIGYRGTMSMIHEAANLLMKGH